jgi:hypothetical protein
MQQRIKRGSARTDGSHDLTATHFSLPAAAALEVLPASSSEVALSSVSPSKPVVVPSSADDDVALHSTETAVDSGMSLEAGRGFHDFGFGSFLASFSASLAAASFASASSFCWVSVNVQPGEVSTHVFGGLGLPLSFLLRQD